MKLIAETGHGPREQTPSIGCSIKWKVGVTPRSARSGRRTSTSGPTRPRALAGGAARGTRAEIDGHAGPGIGGRRGLVAEADGRRGRLRRDQPAPLRQRLRGASRWPSSRAIWVAPEARRARASAGRWWRTSAELVRAEGRGELCSDALIDNLVSHAAHRAWGFAETERVVYFRLALG